MIKLILLRCVGMLPLPIVHLFGVGIGWMFYLVPNRRRSTAKINLALCFPEFGAWRRHTLLRRTLIEFGKTVTETAVLWTCGEPRLRRLVRRVVGEKKLVHAMAQDKGVIFAIPHLGAWELVGLYCSLRYPLSSLYSPLPSPRANQYVRAARERFGSRLVRADTSGVRALYKTLADAKTVAILPDQIPASVGAGVFAPFFGIPTNTTVLLPRLAHKTSAPVMFVYARRLSFGRGYAIHFQPAPSGIHADDVETSATVVNAMVEKCARAVPEQYQWIYKRFRSRRKGERKIY
jgi:KDO2-lipid IV(A) lauroyltransferase